MIQSIFVTLEVKRMTLLIYLQGCILKVKIPTA